MLAVDIFSKTTFVLICILQFRPSCILRHQFCQILQMFVVWLWMLLIFEAAECTHYFCDMWHFVIWKLHKTWSGELCYFMCWRLFVWFCLNFTWTVIFFHRYLQTDTPISWLHACTVMMLRQRGTLCWLGSMVPGRTRWSIGTRSASVWLPSIASGVPLLCTVDSEMELFTVIRLVLW